MRETAVTEEVPGGNRQVSWSRARGGGARGLDFEGNLEPLQDFEHNQ